MDLEFADEDLERLYADPSFRVRGIGPELAKQYRRKCGLVASAADDRDLAAMRSLRFEKLLGDRAGQHSIRLNDQFRLVLELRTEGDRRITRVVEIVDYH